jgi:hypothetical protein
MRDFEAMAIWRFRVKRGSREENASKQGEERFRAKWVPVRVKKARQNKEKSVFERSGYRFA